MEKIVRNKRKCVTIIKGLDMFGKLLSVATLETIIGGFSFIPMIHEMYLLDLGTLVNAAAKRMVSETGTYVSYCLLLIDIVKQCSFGHDLLCSLRTGTNVTGETVNAGIKLSDASKKLGKKFASGASVVKVKFSNEYLYEWCDTYDHLKQPFIFSSSLAISSKMIMNLLSHNLTHALETFSLKMGLLSFFTSSSQFNITNINLDTKSLASFFITGSNGERTNRCSR